MFRRSYWCRNDINKNVAHTIKLTRYSSYLHRASTVSKTLFIVPTCAQYQRISACCAGVHIKLYSQDILHVCTVHQQYQKHILFFQLVNTINAFQPVVQACGSPHACKTGWYAAITLAVSIPTSTEKTFHSFSQAQDCSLMMVPAWTETCLSKCYNFKLF